VVDVSAVDVLFLRQSPPPPNLGHANASGHRITSRGPLLHQNGATVPSPPLPLCPPLAFNSHNRRTYGHQDRPLPATVGLPRPHASSAFAPIKRVPRPRLSSFTHWFLSSMPQHSCLRAPPTTTSIHRRPVEIAASSLVFITGEHTLTCSLFLDHRSELLCPAMVARAHYG
jgi:hypothetical protein